MRQDDTRVDAESRPLPLVGQWRGEIRCTRRARSTSVPPSVRLCPVEQICGSASYGGTIGARGSCRVWQVCRRAEPAPPYRMRSAAQPSARQVDLGGRGDPVRQVAKVVVVRHALQTHVPDNSGEKLCSCRTTYATSGRVPSLSSSGRYSPRAIALERGLEVAELAPQHAGRAWP